jgi:site-specific recombinase XerD
LAFGQWADFFLENYSKPPLRAEETHEANKRCIRHFRIVFQTSRLVDITADSIDLYLRERLRQRVRIKANLGYKYLKAIKATTIHQEFRVLRRMLNVAVRKKLPAANPCSDVEFPVAVKGFFSVVWAALSSRFHQNKPS